MPEFDKEVFELMIEKVIIGEKDNKGKINPRVITFVLKSGNKIKYEDDKNQQSAYEGGENYLQKMCESYGVCSVARVEKMPAILEFTSFQDTILINSEITTHNMNNFL